MDQWEWTSFLVRSALKNNYNLLDQVVHRSSPVIQLIKSRTEQSIFVEIGPYIAKFGPYFIDYSRQSIILLDVMVDHFATGPDHGLDHFFLDRTTHWTAQYFKFPEGGQKQGLKNGPVRSILVDHLSTGPDHGLDHFFLDRTTDWTTFFWTGPHNGPPHIPNFGGGSKTRA